MPRRIRHSTLIDLEHPAIMRAIRVYRREISPEIRVLLATARDLYDTGQKLRRSLLNRAEHRIADIEPDNGPFRASVKQVPNAVWISIWNIAKYYEKMARNWVFDESFTFPRTLPNPIPASSKSLLITDKVHQEEDEGTKRSFNTGRIARGRLIDTLYSLCSKRRIPIWPTIAKVLDHHGISQSSPRQKSRVRHRMLMKDRDRFRGLYDQRLIF